MNVRIGRAPLAGQVAAVHLARRRDKQLEARRAEMLAKTKAWIEEIGWPAFVRKLQNAKERDPNSPMGRIAIRLEEAYLKVVREQRGDSNGCTDA